MNRKKLTLLLLLTLGIPAAQADSEVLTLENCHTLAIRNNKELRMADMQILSLIHI